ncbi:MAG: OmpA family protein [Myxococcales bacterium]|nr:OmpA family protein [Myxococcales bacterium]
MLAEHRTSLAILLTAASVAGCAKKTADLELGLADQALQKAIARNAQECAPDQYQAAEQRLADARRLAEEGDVDEAKRIAQEAESIALQALDASPPGCDTVFAQNDVSEPTSTFGEDASRIVDDLSEALGTIYFDYNQYVIREESKQSLTEVASLLRQVPNTTLDIEGHCDVRGSTEYNLHLGERRARSVMKYLLAQGVDPDQVRTISYGEERPVDFGSTESAHAANRRAELRRP